MPEQAIPEIMKPWIWIIEIAIGMVLVLILSLSVKKGLTVLEQRSKQAESVWGKHVKRIVHLPLQIALWGFGVAYALDVFVSHFGFPSLIRYVRPVKIVFVVVCLGWMLLRWNRFTFRRLAKRSETWGVSAGTIHALGKLTSFVITILVTMILFQVFGLNMAPLIAFGGIGMAGLAFAAQDIVANFFGGTMLHFTRIFSLGDLVVIPSQSNFEGEVKEIGWYTTTIEDHYRRLVYFPNALFTKAFVINESRRSHRRFKETVTLRYDDLANVETIIEELRNKLAGHPSVDQTQSFAINLSKLGEYGIDVYFYLLIYQMPYAQFLQVQQELWLLIYQIVSKHGAEFAYPTQAVHLADK